jgi:hypothetical protein
MVPGFTAVIDSTPWADTQSGHTVELAWIWDTPRGECRFARTDTFCTGVVLWCTEVFVCNDGTLFGHEKSKAPYPCGVCVGISNPSDW